MYGIFFILRLLFRLCAPLTLSVPLASMLQNCLLATIKNIAGFCQANNISLKLTEDLPENEQKNLQEMMATIPLDAQVSKMLKV